MCLLWNSKSYDLQDNELKLENKKIKFWKFWKIEKKIWKKYRENGENFDKTAMRLAEINE
jgi:predicted HAD superfamily hydrolase